MEKYYLPFGMSVLGKTVPEVLSVARVLGPHSRPMAQLFLKWTDRPTSANNVFIFIYGIVVLWLSHKA